VHGEFDPIPLASAQEWAAAAPNARLAIIRMAGHFSYVEQPSQFFPAVEDFLAGRWPAGSIHP
jgi:pimeloyl-ACP methyl ester carboxylesterase